MRVRVQNASLTAYDKARRSYNRRYHALVRAMDQAQSDAEYDALRVKLVAANAKLDEAAALAAADAEYVEVRS